MWSEPYKHSKPFLKQFPTTLACLNGPGEGAVVDIGDNQAVVFWESHNHPSAIEPIKTGVGGIIRYRLNRSETY